MFKSPVISSTDDSLSTPITQTRTTERLRVLSFSGQTRQTRLAGKRGKIRISSCR